MKRMICIASIAASALIAPASAADLNRGFADEPAYRSALSWAGFYAGGHLGVDRPVTRTDIYLDAAELMAGGVWAGVWPAEGSMCGRRPRCKKILAVLLAVGCKSCVRPVRAVHDRWP